MSKIIDISPPINSQLAVWPGDTPPTREILLDRNRGDNVTLSTLRATVHLGAHADAPNHVDASLPGIDSRSLDAFLGPCQVIHVAVAPGQRIRPEHLPVPIAAPRILLATGTFPDPTTFTTDFASLDPTLVDHLADLGVVLIGLDTPSVDPFDSTDLPSHHALNRRGLANLEGLRLAHVPPGLYELIALPLALSGYDASPVRAILRTPI